jgi:hypothetical protein
MVLAERNKNIRGETIISGRAWFDSTENAFAVAARLAGCAGAKSDSCEPVAADPTAAASALIPVREIQPRPS